MTTKNMHLLDGKKLSQKILSTIKADVANIQKQIRLGIVVVGEDPAIRSFINQKKKAAELVGIDVRIYPFDESITTNELRKRLKELVHEVHNDGIVIQLPLPKHMNTQYILNSIVPEKDVDVLSARAIGNFAIGRSPILPPVVGAVKALLGEYSIDYRDKHIVVLGAGMLVGKPLAMWLLSEKATFSVVERDTKNPEIFLRDADIIISGLGKSKFLTADLIKDGAVIIDAGTSESEGELSGDVDAESVAKKASYLTPVPGGVGPMTVAVLLENLVWLVKLRN